MQRDSADPHHDRRWLILAVIGIAQLMVVLDVTIVNIALPSAQRDLGFSDEDRQWVITAYALAFGSLLLLGGRIADLFGRKWTFIAGLLGFAGASALGGAAQSFELLVAARALQGVFAALLAPAALSLLATTFTDPAERGKAFGVYGAIAGAGGAFGLLLGGALTEVLDWRWCLYVSIAFAVPAAAAGTRLLHTVPGSAGTRPRLVVADRNRGGAFLSVATAGAGIFGVFLFLTFYLQNTKGLTALETGLAFMPMNASVIAAATIVSTRLLARTGPKPLAPAGMASAAIGMLLLTRIGVDTAYASHVLPSMILIGLGFGTIIASSLATATYGVPAQDSGAASAMVNTSQQVGGSIGTALLSTLAVSATTDVLADNGPAPDVLRQAAVEGYVTAFWWAAAIFALGALVSGSLLRSDARPEMTHGPAPQPRPAHA